MNNSQTETRPINLPTNITDDYNLLNFSPDPIIHGTSRIVREMSQNDDLKEVNTQFQTVLGALKNCHERIKRNLKESRDYDKMTLAIAQKIPAFLKYNEQDEIDKLDKKIKTIWIQVEDSQQNEKKLKERNESLALEINVLKKLINHGMTNNDDQILLKKLHSQKDALEKESSESKTKMMRLESDVKDKSLHYEETLKQKEEVLAKIKEIKQKYLEKQREIQETASLKRDAEQNLVRAKQEYDERSRIYADTLNTLKLNKEELSTATDKLNDQSSKSEHAVKDVEFKNTKLNKVKQSLAKQLNDNTMIQAHYDEVQSSIHRTEDLKNRTSYDLDVLLRKKEKCNLLINKLKQQCTNIENEKHEKNRTIKLLQKDVELIKRDLESLELKIKEYVHQNNILKKTLLNTDEHFNRQQDALKVKENRKKNLERKILGYRVQAEHLRKQQYTLEKELQRYTSMKDEAMRKYLAAQEELSIEKAQTEALKKKISMGEQQQKKQQNMYDTVINDRNVYNKNFQNTKNMIDNVDTKFKNMSQQISHLKEELINSDRKIMKRNNAIREENKKKDELKEKMKQTIEEIDAKKVEHIKAQKKIQRLNQIIREADHEQKDRSKELDGIINDRDILGSQLIKRNDELASLYEKIKIQQSLLNKGGYQYQDILSQRTILESQISALTQKRNQLQPEIATIDTLRTECNVLTKELLREQQKIKKLSEELDRPLNVHRWRKLKSTQPHLYKKIKQTHKIQAEIVSKQNELDELELKLSSNEKLYTELQAVMERQPGAEIVEQIAVYQKTYKKKQKQYDDSRKELKRVQKLVKVQKEEQTKLIELLEDVKKDYFTMRETMDKRDTLPPLRPPTSSHDVTSDVINRMAYE